MAGKLSALVHLLYKRPMNSQMYWDTDFSECCQLLMATMDRRLVAETTLLDVFLMSEADYVVGTLSSHFGALAYELSVARKGFHPPYISLDFPWR